MAEKECTQEPFIQDRQTSYSNEVTGTPKFWMSCRFKFGLIVFTANILSYLHRVNLNMVIVCMLESSRQATNEAQFNITTNNQTEIYQSINDSMDILETPTKNFTYKTKINTVWSELETLNMTHALDLLSKTVGTGNTSDVHFMKTTETRRENNPKINITSDGSDPTVVSEFSWNKAQISLILSSYYYGSIVTQIPGGHLAHRFGGKHVISVFFVITGICSLLAPVAVKTSTALMFVIRILIGTAGGLFMPAMYSITMNWTKPSQRATLLSMMISGQPLGIVIAYFTSGFLCALGWSTIFYVHGALMFLVLSLWLYEIHSFPAEHPRISQAELKYLTRHLTANIPVKTVPPTPWKSILLSRPQWAATLAHFSFNWSYYTLIINVPLFLKEVFAYVITENGVYSALPYVFCTVSLMFSGKLSAIVVKKKLLTLPATRKFFNGMCQGGIAVCILGAGQVTYELRFLAVILICVSCIFVGFNFGGVIPSYADFAGIFSGTAFAFGNAIGVISVILSAVTAGLLTPNGTRHEWQNVFYVAAGINVFSTIVYSIFGEATLQKWAVVEGSTKEIGVELDDDNFCAKKMDASLGKGHLKISNAENGTN